jgi:hypothetical protein
MIKTISLVEGLSLKPKRRVDPLRLGIAMGVVSLVGGLMQYAKPQPAEQPPAEVQCQYFDDAGMTDEFDSPKTLIALSDIDGDGDLDLIVAREGELRVYENCSPQPLGPRAYHAGPWIVPRQEPHREYY